VTRFSSNLDLKNRISSYTKCFMEKMARICQIWMIPPRAVEVYMPKFYPPNTGNYLVAFFHQIKAIKGQGSAAGKKHGVETQGVDELRFMGFCFWWKHNSRPNQTSHRHPQVKLIGRGPTGVSIANHWVLNPRPFVIPGISEGAM
jgi:hypothetical protein